MQENNTSQTLAGKEDHTMESRSPPATLRNCLIGGAIGAVGVTVGTPVLLGVVGFGANGVVGGSSAAVIQSMIGNVAAGSAFAAAMSVGATGAVSLTTSALGGLFGSLGGACAGGSINSNCKNWLCLKKGVEGFI